LTVVVAINMPLLTELACRAFAYCFASRSGRWVAKWPKMNAAIILLSKTKRANFALCEPETLPGNHCAQLSDSMAEPGLNPRGASADHEGMVAVPARAIR